MDGAEQTPQGPGAPDASLPPAGSSSGPGAPVTDAAGTIVRPRKDGHVISNLTKDIVCRQLGIDNVLHRQIYTKAKAYAVKHDLGTYREWRTIPSNIKSGIQDALEAEFDVLGRCERNWGASHFMLQAYGVLRSANARKRESDSATRSRLLRSDSELDLDRAPSPHMSSPHASAARSYSPAPLLPPIHALPHLTQPNPPHPLTLPAPTPPSVPIQEDATWYRQVTPAGVEYYVKVSRQLYPPSGVARTLGTTYTRQFLDDRNRAYFYNNLTRESRWEAPDGGGLYVRHWEKIEDLPLPPS